MLNPSPLSDEIREKISFIHSGCPLTASYRYRAKMPAEALGIPLNRWGDGILVLSKPTEQEVSFASYYKKKGRTKIVADFCDDHFDRAHYRALLELADRIVVPTANMAGRIKWDTQIIPDPYEFEEVEPHCNGNRLLWFGHGSNLHSFQRIVPGLMDTFHLVSNVEGTIPWSMETMVNEFALADIVLMPATKDYKSPNRTVESIRQGCFVVAEPHPALEDFPGIWIGDIHEGIEWAKHNPQEANQRTKMAQEYVRNNFSPCIQATAWKNLLMELAST